jgi:CheY-like chemotaxis protein
MEVTSNDEGHSEWSRLSLVSRAGWRGHRVCAFFEARKGDIEMNSRIVTVFYVDDNDRSRGLLTSILTECGFEMITAADPAEALRRCGEISFDLALLDYEMRALTGSQLAQHMKLVAPDIPVVLISSHTVLPAKDLMFVDAHFGYGTTLDDLVDTMRRLTRPKRHGSSNR